MSSLTTTPESEPREEDELAELRRSCQAFSVLAEVSLSAVLQQMPSAVGIVEAPDGLRFLAEASKILSSSLDYETTLKAVTSLAVPRLADWCALELLLEDGVSAQLAVAHADPAKIAFAEEMRQRYPPDKTSATDGLWRVLRSGVAEIYEDITDDLLVLGARDEEHLRITRELGLRSVIIAPLSTHGKTLGALTLVTAESGRRFGPADLALAQELAGRAALAVENARLYREAQEAVRKRDEFLSVASHELRTPLTSLSLHTSSLLRVAQLGRMESLALPKLTERLAKADAQVRRLASLVDELLDVSRISTGHLALDPQEVELSALASDVTARFQDQADASGCVLRFEAPGPVVGRWDRNRLDQVLTNLVSNAVKYAAGKPVDIRVEALSSADGVVTGARLSVRDEGRGIAPEDQVRIFERFERAAPSKTFAGMGLGLWIAKQIVDAHGGVIKLTSQPGSGSIFTVELPPAAP